MLDQAILQNYPAPIARAFARLRESVTEADRREAAQRLLEATFRYLCVVVLATYRSGRSKDLAVEAGLRTCRKASLGRLAQLLAQTLDHLSEARRQSQRADKLVQALREESVVQPALLRLHRELVATAEPARTQTDTLVLATLFEAYARASEGPGFAQLPADLLCSAAVAPLDYQELLAAETLVFLESVNAEVAQVVDLTGCTAERSAFPVALLGVSVQAGSLSLYRPGRPPQFLSLAPFATWSSGHVCFFDEVRPETSTATYRAVTGETVEIQGVELLSAREHAGVEPTASSEATIAESGDSFLVENFEILRRVGQGAMGIVYEARQRSLNRNVALKVLPAEFSLDPKKIERFKREAYALAAVNHPNIVTIHDITQYGGQSLICMEFIEGETLREIVAQRGPLPIADALAYARQLIDALKVLHEHKILHRDIKPSNVMITPQGVVKLLDFSIAKPVEEMGPTLTGGVVGTPAYMSPEQRRGDTLGPATDIYSFGVTMYEALSGVCPDATGELPAALHRAKTRQKLPRSIADALMRCLDRDPARRIGMHDLERALFGKPSGRRMLPIAATVVVLLAALAFGLRDRFVSAAREATPPVVPAASLPPHSEVVAAAPVKALPPPDHDAPVVAVDTVGGDELLRLADGVLAARVPKTGRELRITVKDTSPVRLEVDGEPVSVNADGVGVARFAWRALENRTHEIVARDEQGNAARIALEQVPEPEWQIPVAKLAPDNSGLYWSTVRPVTIAFPRVAEWVPCVRVDHETTVDAIEEGSAMTASLDLAPGPTPFALEIGSRRTTGGAPVWFASLAMRIAPVPELAVSPVLSTRTRQAATGIETVEEKLSLDVTTASEIPGSLLALDARLGDQALTPLLAAPGRWQLVCPLDREESQLRVTLAGPFAKPVERSVTIRKMPLPIPHVTLAIAGVQNIDPALPPMTRNEVLQVTAPVTVFTGVALTASRAGSPAGTVTIKPKREGEQLVFSVPLSQDGEWILELRAVDEFARDLALDTKHVIAKRTGPQIVLAAPVPQDQFFDPRLSINGSLTDPYFTKPDALEIEIRLNGKSIERRRHDPGRAFARDLWLQSGDNTIEITATDGIANTTSVSRTVRLELPENVASADAKLVNTKNGAELVFVRTDTGSGLKPRGFYIGVHEVTVEEFAAFIDAGGYRRKEFWDETGWGHLSGEQWSGPAVKGAPEAPVAGVSFYEAAAYARFCGMALPSETEWLTAALADGVRERKFPWGDAFEPDRVCGESVDRSQSAPVAAKGTFAEGRSAAGCFHMMGNVEEWCLKGSETAMDTAQSFVARGGSFRSKAAELAQGLKPLREEIRRGEERRRQIGIRLIKRVP